MDCAYQQKDVFYYMISVTPSVIAALVLWVAWRQYKISKEKVRLDLYNRRFDIYSRTIDFYHALETYDAAQPTKEAFVSLLKGFGKSCRESQFLFDKDSGIYELLEAIS